MAQLGGTLVTPPTGGTSVQRPCPYCGTWNEPDFSFCKKCGRQLPSLAETATIGPAAMPPPPPASVVPPPPFAAIPPAISSPDVDASVIDRPLTEAELGLLKRAVKSGAAGGTRFFGAFVGIIPLFLIGMAMMGTPFVPENYIAIVLVSGFLGVVLSGVSQSLRGPLLRAARDGTAHEVYGMPEIQAAPGNQALVSLGGLTFRMKASVAATLLPNRMNRVTFADGGPTAGARRQFGSGIALVLESNGKAATRPEIGYLVDPNAAAAPAMPRKKLGGR